MASVQFTWSDMWLQWYAEQVNDEVKNEFLEQVELQKLVTRVSPKVQLEILEFAPEDVKILVADSLHQQYRDRILWNIEEVEENNASDNGWEKITKDSCLYPYGVAMGYIKEVQDNEASKSM